MSQIRQRKRTPNKNDDDDDDSPPPDLLECASARSSDSSSSFEKYFDGDDGTSPNGYANNNNNNNNTEKETTPLTKQLPKPNNTPTNNNNISKLDKFLNTYGAFTAKTFTTDQALKILQWSSWAISYATRPTSTTTSPSSNTTSILSPSLKILSSELSFTRYILRFFGFFNALEGFRSGSWSGGKWDNPSIARIAKYGMAASMLVYHPLEFVAYAGWKFPALKKRVDANKFSAASCVFWTTYIIGDFWCSVLKWKELKDKLGRVREVLGEAKRRRGGDGDKDAITNLPKEEVDLLNKIRHVKLQLVRCLLFVLPAINWSLPNWTTNPLLSELQLNGLMLAEAYTSVYQSLQAMSG